jgi:hypothetical protein
MRNLLAFLAALVLTLAGVGWYLGWFEVSSNRSFTGHRQVHIDIDTQKVGKDIEKGKETIEGAVEKAREEANKNRPASGQ